MRQKNDINKDIDNIFLNKKENLIHEKNIENLVNEIKEAEKKMQKEVKETKFTKKKITRISMPKIELTPINIQTIQYILSSKARNQNMLIVLNALLSNMKFVSIVTDLNDKEKLIASLSNCLKLEKRQKGSILFRYGNKGTRFYIVLGGEISVLILKEVEVELTFLNYIKYLFYLKIIKEDDLAKKILAANSNGNFRLREGYLDRYYEDIISFINRYYIKTSFKEYEEKKYTSVKKVLKLGSAFKKPVEQTQKIKKENEMNNIKLFNNQLKLNVKDFKTFKRQSTINESKLNSVILHKNDILSIQDEEEIEKEKENKEEKEVERKEKYEEKEEESEISEKGSDEKNEDINHMDDINFDKKNDDTEFFDEFNENNPKIKYVAGPKIPNYFELDIGFLGPYDLSDLVNYVITNLELFYQKPNMVSSIDEYIKMCSINNNLKENDKNNKKEKVTIFKYFEITKKVEGDKFGELALQHADNKRTATLIVTKDSVLGYLSKSDYNHSLRGIEMKKRKIDINFIMSFSFFEEQNWIHFEKQYFNFFKKETFTSGKVIINQNEKLENIYFIMEGQFEISTKLSFDDIIQILKQKNKRIKPQKYNENTLVKDENIKVEINKDNVDENNNEDENIKIYNKRNDNSINRKKYMLLTKKQKKQLKEVKNYRLCVVDNKDVIGLNDICTEDKKSFIKATCLSSDAVVFSIKINILEQLRKKNKKLEKNIQKICQRREKIMIERLKIVTNQVMMNIKQAGKKYTSNIKENENTTINKEKRIISALKIKYSNKISLEYENTVNNYKNEMLQSNIDKRIKDKNSKELNQKSNKIICLKNQNNINKNNNFISQDEISLDDNRIKSARKSGFKKFMESVTERVNQINHHINYSKFSRLFCPINPRSKLCLEKKKNRIMMLKLKESDLKNNSLKTENNIINVKKISSNDKNEKENKILSPLIIHKKENQILSNKYLNKMVATINSNEKIYFSEFKSKTCFKEKLSNIMTTESLVENYKEYIKRILGVKYREYETSKGQKTFTKMLIPNIEKAQFAGNFKNRKTNYKSLEKSNDIQPKPIKVDLLFYDQITKKNKANYLKDLILEKQIKQRIISRNVKKNYMTISVEKTEKN